jgi:hypothetical protein
VSQLTLVKDWRPFAGNSPNATYRLDGRGQDLPGEVGKFFLFRKLNAPFAPKPDSVWGYAQSEKGLLSASV